MSSIPYSGGTIVNTTFVTTTGTRQEIVTALQTHLTTAGWTVISGGGTGTVVMKSAVTAAPKSNSIRVRLLEVGSGNCAQVKIENDAGTLTSQAFFLLPAAAKTFRIIACKYNFFVMTPGVSVAREFVCGGTMHIPVNLEGVVTADLGWMQGNAISDTDTTNVNCFRKKMYATGYNGINGYSSQIRNLLLMQDVGGISPAGGQSLFSSLGGPSDLVGCFKWSDGALVTREAILCFGTLLVTGVAELQGLIHNCMIVTDNFAVDNTSITSYDGHSWHGITGGNAGSSSEVIGTLFAAIT